MSVKVKMLFAQDVQQQTNGSDMRNVVIEPVFVLRVPFVPAGVKFGLLILTQGIDFTRKNKFVIEIKNETGEEIFTTGEQILDINPINNYDNYNFNISVESAPIKKEGKIVATFTLNGDSTIEELEVVANENLLAGNA